MASATTYTAAGAKSAAKTTLDRSVFGVEVKSHALLKQAYVSYLANGRLNLAVTKTRGLVSGGGKKPWKQKGTGRARFGSSRVPIWRGGGITFGPTGNENYSLKMNIKAKRQAIRQALSLAVNSDKLKVVDSFSSMEKKTKDLNIFLGKVGAQQGRVLCVVSEKDASKERAAGNIANLKVTSAMYLNVFDVMNADHILVSKKSLDVISEWLGEPIATKRVTAPTANEAK